MKATGEVMAIGRTFEESFESYSFFRNRNSNILVLNLNKRRLLTEEDIERRIRVCDDERLFIIGEALRKGYDWETIVEWSKIDKFCLEIQKLVDFEKQFPRTNSIKKFYFKRKN